MNQETTRFTADLGANPVKIRNSKPEKMFT